MNDYYVYGLVDPINKEIFYVGKGKKKRYLSHLQVFNKDYKYLLRPTDRPPSNKNEKIAQIIRSGNEIEYLFFIENISEEAAYCLEILLIERFGRVIRKNGNLFNLEAGGPSHLSGLLLSQKDIPSFAIVKTKFPELIPILDKYPRIAPKDKRKPWWERKIPKNEALYEYTIKGDLLQVHYCLFMRFSTGYDSRLIKDCIENNEGYAYSSQWSNYPKQKMRNLDLDSVKLAYLIKYSNWEKVKVERNSVFNYERRNQSVKQ